MNIYSQIFFFLFSNASVEGSGEMSIIKVSLEKSIE